MARSTFSAEEKEFIKKLQGRPRRFESGDATFENVLRGIAEGKSLDAMGLVSLDIKITPTSGHVVKRTP